MNNLTINTIGLVYNTEGKFLIGKRSSIELHEPGLYSYLGGKLDYNGELQAGKSMFLLEENLKREIKEEAGVEIEVSEYLSSHAFVKDNGDKVVVIAYLAEYVSGILTPQQDEVEELTWITRENLKEINTLDIIKEVYTQAFDKIEQNRQRFTIELAGIVLNDNEEFLLVKKNNSAEKFSLPSGAFSSKAVGSWEVMESSLAKIIFQQTGIEIADGPIPFTDQLLMDKTEEKLLQLFICRYKYGNIQIKSPEEIAEVKWIHINDIERKDLNERDYLILYKASDFISKLND
ncbi:NUDIX hydrolase [Candidatus Dojkabacteria bacterium]|uniref:NUDIX hydrolase n=1 Tax=Candidatus Dojkabacteria bacterium TaxID=2099670 RepID=A0A952ALF8_9BACT|nr:NUDIX hydrolase [Candidatus Dojkabacteria bacterium]